MVGWVQILLNFAKILFIGFSSPVKGHLISQPTPDVSSRWEILGLQKLNVHLFNFCAWSITHSSMTFLNSRVLQADDDKNPMPTFISFHIVSKPFLQSSSAWAPDPHPCAAPPSSAPANTHLAFQHSSRLRSNTVQRNTVTQILPEKHSNTDTTRETQ